jgi:hypothetical protein
MKKISTYLFLILFSFSAPSFADDISEYQIEGISIGDSLLDHFKREEFINNKKSYYNDKFVVIRIIKNSFENYEYLQFVFKPNDKNYIIHSVEGHIDYHNNIQSCYEKKKIIDSELFEIFSKIAHIENVENKSVNYDKTGNTKVSTTEYFLDTEGTIRVSCTDFSKKLTENKKWYDALRVVINSSEFTQFLTNEWK